ncbi:hypothetical protein [Emcibacter sp. SYSU 3D8]|uniref:hypothetical protein n=1 Tax=Emcibacter sp. SYSU 3D8 TaxID=3133969 RepID=UPI0031FE88DC
MQLQQAEHDARLMRQGVFRGRQFPAFDPVQPQIDGDILLQPRQAGARADARSLRECQVTAISRVLESTYTRLRNWRGR